jgi:hypothetical protein
LTVAASSERPMSEYGVAEEIEAELLIKRCVGRVRGRDREAPPIGIEDWPILWQLEHTGKLTFQSDDIRDRFQRMKP